jgi:hypothetical protein
MAREDEMMIQSGGEKKSVGLSRSVVPTIYAMTIPSSIVCDRALAIIVRRLRTRKTPRKLALAAKRPMTQSWISSGNNSVIPKEAILERRM